MIDWLKRNWAMVGVMSSILIVLIAAVFGLFFTVPYQMIGLVMLPVIWLFGLAQMAKIVG